MADDPIPQAHSAFDAFDTFDASPAEPVGARFGVGTVLRWIIQTVVLLAFGAFALDVIGVTGLTIGPQAWDWLTQPAIQAWATVLAAVVIQSLPFLLMGTAVSAAITALIPDEVLGRLLPSRPALAVPVAAAAGAALPGCECASVPVAASLIRRGVAPPAALAFLLAAPAVNPVVLVATSVAFPGRPQIVLARLLTSLVVSMTMGWLWLRLGRPEWLRLPPRPATPAGRGRLDVFIRTLHHDFLHAGGFLVLGATAAATVNVAVPPSLLHRFAGSPWLAAPVLAILAVVLSICSEADAFVAASLPGFSNTARLTFMAVGPMVDLKLIALQTGTFGRAFAARFCAATFAIAVVASTVIGGWLL